jgi:hypothetical protein
MVHAGRGWTARSQALKPEAHDLVGRLAIDGHRAHPSIAKAPLMDAKKLSIGP